MKTRIGGALLAVAVALGGVLAVGSADAAKKKPKPTRLGLQADPRGGLSFSKRSLNAKHGVVIITMKNPRGSGLPHGIGVRGNGVDRDGKIVNPGHTSQVTVTLRKGTYTFYCPFDGHAGAGMKGTLTVR